MDFLTRSDYQRVVLYILTSVAVLLSIKYLLPYFLPLLVALLIVVPLQRFCRGRKKTGQKGFMAGGILFAIILVVALIIVGHFCSARQKCSSATQTFGRTALHR